MEIRFSNKPNAGALYIYPVFEKHAPRDSVVKNILLATEKSGGFKRTTGETFFTLTKNGKPAKRILLLGMGDIKKLNMGEVMSAFGAAIKAAMNLGARNIAVNLTETCLHNFAQAITEAVCMASYQPGIPYKTAKELEKLKKKQLQAVEFVGLGKNSALLNSCKKGFTVASSANEVKDWVNAPPNFATPDFFANKAREIAKNTGAKLTILRNKELKKLGMGALLAVNRGSPDEALLVIMDYTPKNWDPKKPPLVIVGKGLIFDSGGYNLKPAGYIEDMQLDKAGGAAVFGIINLLPKLNINHRVIGVVPFTESLIGKNALKPSEILKSYSGKTVEITNTDGEGRLILADAMAYAIDEYKPAMLIDIATLTGACMVALGDRYAGLFGNDDRLTADLRAAGEKTDELLWTLPMHKDYAEKMKGVYADLRNADLGSERLAGASKAAAFLQEFIGKTKWAHIDIAAPAFTEDPKKYEQKGATGFGMRLLLRFLEDLR